MSDIAHPKQPRPYLDRELDCQQAIEREFQDLIERATSAGWGPAEAIDAVEQLALADRFMRRNKSAIDGYRMLDDLIAARQSHG